MTTIANFEEFKMKRSIVTEVLKNQIIIIHLNKLDKKLEIFNTKCQNLLRQPKMRKV